MKPPRNWYRFENLATDPSVAEIHIIDIIGSWDDDWFARNFGYDMGVTARAFVEELARLPESVKSLHVHINSPGGDVQAGVNIANALRDQQVSKGRTVETFVDGIAASIASVIAMAGSKVHIADNALFMIHEPYTIDIGNAAQLRKSADVLDTMRGQIIATYQWHSALDAEALTALMVAETWMSADEALANGFATDKIEGLKAAAALDRRAVATLKVPDKYRDRVNALLKPEPAKPTAAAAADVLRACREGGCLELAEDLLAANATTDQVTEKIAATKAARAAADARATEITQLCAIAKLPELAAGYISGQMAIADIQTHLTTVTAKMDRVEIDTTLAPDGGSKAAAGASLNAGAIYRERNRLTLVPKE